MAALVAATALLTAGCSSASPQEGAARVQVETPSGPSDATADAASEPWPTTNPADAGFDPQALLSLASDQAVKDALKSATEEAVRRGVFGAPTCFVGDEMFFGQDRLDFVEEALA